MKTGVWIVLVVAAVSIAVFFVISNGLRNTSSDNQSSASLNSSGPVKCYNPQCLGQNFPSCTPAGLFMTLQGQTINITINGFENEKCHFTMAFKNSTISITAADCYFKQVDLTDKVLNQMFGKDEGQAAVIAEACKRPGQ